MTYRFGRTGRKRNAAMQQGMMAYTGGPAEVYCAEGYHLDVNGKCVKDDPEAALGGTIVIRPPKPKSGMPSRRRRRR